MAGVTNARSAPCAAGSAPGLVYVNEMVMATALVHGNAKTERMVTFGPDEQPRSLQLYGSDPEMMGAPSASVCDTRARRPRRPQLRLPGGQGHPQGWGSGGAGQAGAAAGDRAGAVRRPPPYGVPVTAKFRMGSTTTC